MKSLFPLIAAAAVLAACSQKQPDVVETRAPDPNAEALRNAAPVELPPAIRSQKSYRCADGSLAFVTWFAGDKQASARAGENGTPVIVKSADGKSPWTAEDGTKLTGTDDKIVLTPAGGKALSCHT